MPVERSLNARAASQPPFDFCGCCSRLFVGLSYLQQTNFAGFFYNFIGGQDFRDPSDTRNA
jgi:hypothetical protein